MDEYINTGAYLRILWDELRLNMEDQLKEQGFADVSPSHGWIFHNIKEEGSRVTELAAIARITKQSMSALVAQLEKSGYVKKKNDPTDKRAWLLVLTPKGKKVKEAMHEMKRGKLTSGRSGKKVKSRKQAIAIGLSEARAEGAKVPAKKGAKKGGARKRGSSRGAKKIIGVEAIDAAVQDARENATLNNIGHAEFFTGDVVDVCNDDFFQGHGRPDVIITDPPRAGMHQKLVEKILDMEAPTVVYVSCNPATQARDLALLDAKYTVTITSPVVQMRNCRLRNNPRCSRKS